MSRIVLALMAILLLIVPLGLVDSPSCQMNDLAQATTISNVEPCPASAHSASFNTVRVHDCDCGVLILPAPLFDTTAPSHLPLSVVAALWPQSIFTLPLKPPPRAL